MTEREDSSFSFLIRTLIPSWKLYSHDLMTSKMPSQTQSIKSISFYYGYQTFEKIYANFFFQMENIFDIYKEYKPSLSGILKFSNVFQLNIIDLIKCSK